MNFFLTVLSTELGVVGENLLACMRDGASVNGKAMCTIGIMYPKVMNITCFSHALDLVGSKFVIPNLNKFTKHWFTIVQHSSKAKLLWRERTGQSLKSYSSTRWWSKWECQKQLMLLWGDVPTFLTSCIVQHSSKAKLLWRERTGQSLKSYSSTRWWSKWECQKQLILLWGDVPTFLTSCISNEIETKNCEKLLDLLQNNLLLNCLS